MFAQKISLGRHFLWMLSLVASLLSLTAASPALAATCDGTSTICEFDREAIVSVANLNFVCTPPSPITQGIQITGDFVIRAHIVVPPSPVLPPSPILPMGTVVTLHLDATRVSGVGLTDGTLYQGGQATSQGFGPISDTMTFGAIFDLMPSQSNKVSPSSVCPTQLLMRRVLMHYVLSLNRSLG
jgi:hypothetical protein